MEAVEVIQDLENALADVKNNGRETVAVAALEKYLGNLRLDASYSIEFRKIETQHTLANFDSQTKHSIEMFKSVIDAGREALNALILINGGAVIALLGFMGATISKGMPNSLGYELTFPLLQFGFGVLVGALGFGSRYIAQFFYAAKYRIAGHTFNAISSLLAASGFILFGFAMYGAYQAFAKQFGG